ncbi:hypothetical protein LZF95_23290 [Algoriphagus sp. AGSA1]|uniref:hypothetical protein n=1 Tax=Algoriphagus sp. AGSA1 TaxID=2907213 RepID=UPI001F463BA7|nr:hypothetical protein [Algoriphagus sp. AGSA1]MCE7057626.1 hypothetical protein [Algoriphagus sp. AGSA1]
MNLSPVVIAIPVYFILMAIEMILTGFFLFKVDTFTWVPEVLLSLLIVWTTVSFSGIFEKRAWYAPQEIARILAFAGLVFFLAQTLLPLPALGVVLVIYCLASFFWLWKNQQLKSDIHSISM